MSISSSSAVDPSPKGNIWGNVLLRNEAKWLSYLSSAQPVSEGSINHRVDGNSIVSDCVRVGLGRTGLCMMLAWFMLSLFDLVSLLNG